MGSRTAERPYCSKVCCSHSVENALELKEMNPDLDVSISRVIDENCDGCAFCIDACSIQALTLIEYMFDGKAAVPAWPPAPRRASRWRDSPWTR